MRLNKRALIIVATTSVWLACKPVVDPPPPPPPAGPGLLTISLTTPNTNDGALFFTVSGGAFDSLTSSFNMFTTANASNSQSAIITGSITGGAVATFWVLERDNASSYTATVQQAAVRSTYAQQSTTGYSLSIAQ